MNGTRRDRCVGAKHGDGEDVDGGAKHGDGEDVDGDGEDVDGTLAHFCEECALQLNAVAQDVRAPIRLERIR